MKILKISLALQSLLAVSAVAILASCGQPKVKTPAGQKLNPPDFNNSGNFNLTSFDLKGTSFNGSLVIFNAGIQPESVTNLFATSNDYNAARIARNSFFSNFEKTTIEPQRATVAQTEAELESLENEANAHLLSLRSDAAKTWLTGQAAGLVAQMPGLDAARVNNVLNYYCEAKLWDFALSPAAFEKSYKQRPTPAAVCEGIYAANTNARFFEDPSCAPNAAGQSYLECIWKAGVKRTSYYKNAFLKSDTATADSEGPLHQKFWALVFDPVFEATIVIKPPEGSDCDPALRSRILQGSKAKPSNNNNLCNGTKYDFANKLPDGVAKNAAPESSTLQNIINAIEVREAGNVNTDLSTPGAYSDLVRIVPTKWSPDGAPSTAENQATEFALREKIRNFMTPASGCSKVFRTPNDLLFNGLMTARALGDGEKCLLPDLNTTSLPEILPQDTFIQKKRAELTQLQLDLGNNQNNTACVPTSGCEGQSSSHVACTWLRAYEHKTAAINCLPGVELLVKELRLIPVRDASGSTSLELLFDNYIAGHVCLGASGNPQAPCAENVLEQEASPMTMSFDESIGHLVLTLPLTDKSLLATARDPEIASRKYAGKTLHLDLYANSYEDKASYLSGKAFIKNGSEEIAQGQASYLMNETDDQPVKSYCDSRK